MKEQKEVTVYCKWRDLHNAAERVRIIGETLCGNEVTPSAQPWFHLLKLAARELQEEADRIYPEIDRDNLYPSA